MDERGTFTTVWDDLLKTDKEALKEAILSLETEGVDSFIINSHKLAKENEPELLKPYAH